MRLSTLGRSAFLAAAAFSAACVPGGGLLRSRETITETRDLEPGGRFTLENTNGGVSVTTWSEPRVRIEAEKAATSAEALKNLEVEIDGKGSQVEVRTRQRRGTFWLFGGGGKVDYRITLPREARVRVQNVNGGLTIEGLSGELDASTVNGGIDITEASGAVEASSVNGGIRTAYRTWSADGRHHFSTVNGGITVTAPPSTGGRLEAKTVNGSIDNGLPLEATGRRSRHRLEGRLGPGHGSLSLETINGSIRLVRG
jgi:DUF4097 and DUF4098 domain-containing protein YvlB